MRKNLLFSMAVAVVMCFAVVTATILTGCGSKSTINTVNVYRETPKYEVGNLTDHTSNLEGVEFCYEEIKSLADISANSPNLIFDNRTSSIKNLLNVSDNNSAIVKKVIDGVEKYGVYSFKSGSVIFNFKECLGMKILAETNSATYVSYTTIVDGKSKLFVEECGVGIVFEGETSASSTFNVRMIGYVEDGKTTYEMWRVNNNGENYYELHKIKSNKRTVVFETRVDAGDPIWQNGIVPLAEQSEKLTLKNMYLFIGGYMPSGGVTNVEIYNMKKLKNVGSMEFPVGNMSSAVLIGNSLLYQRVVELPASATEYDFVDDRGDMYLLETKILNCLTGKVTELDDFGYIIESENSDELFTDYAVVSAVKISENKYYDSSEYNFTKIQINENGKINDVGMYDYAVKLSDDRYVLIYDEETAKLVDGHYNCIAELSGLTNLEYEAVGEMIVAENGTGKYGVISRDGKCIVDFKYDEVFCTGNGAVMLIEYKMVDGVNITNLYSVNNKGEITELYSYNSNDGKYLFKGVEVTGLEKGTNAFAVRTIVDGTTVYTCYNAKGEQIGVLTDAVGSGNVFNIVNYGKNGKHIAFVLVANSGTVDAKIVAISTWHNNSLEK